MRFIYYAINALLAENLIFSRLLGVEGILNDNSDSKEILKFGVALTVSTTLSAIITFLVNYFILIKFDLAYLQIIVFTLVAAACVKGLEFLRLTFNTEKYFMQLMSSSVILGVSFIIAKKEYSFVKVIILSVFGCVGYVGAVYIMRGINKQIRYNDIPKAFRGIPITLLTAALVSLVFMGFLGV